MARPVMAGVAWPGAAWPDAAWFGLAGRAWFGWVRWGVVWHGYFKRMEIKHGIT